MYPHRDFILVEILNVEETELYRILHKQQTSKLTEVDCFILKCIFQLYFPNGK